MKKITVSVIVAFTLVLLALSCANQVAPGGGPEDKTPPETDRTFPAHGQLRVDPHTPITVRFTEWINPASAQRAVTVYPTPHRGVSVKAAKDRITITPREPLLANTTYQVVISTTLQDLRGNSPASPIIIAFSTGDALDSGRVSGRIVPFDKKPAAPPRVALFYEDGEWNDARYFTAPDYAAQSDSAGLFNFSFLREGRYRAVAFIDQYRTGRMRSGDECYTAVEQTITVTKEELTVRLYPSDCDTAITATVKDTAVGDTATANDSTVNDKSVNKKTAAPDTAAPELKEYLPSRVSSLRPELRLVWTKPARLNVSVIMAVDTAGTDSVPFFRAAYSYAEQNYSDTTRLAPAKSLSPGRVYRLTIDPNTVRDEHGNTARGKVVRRAPREVRIDNDTAAAESVAVEPSATITDTSGAGSITADPSITTIDTLTAAVDTAETRTIEIILRTVAADSICYRLQVVAECLASEPDANRKWVYRPINWQERFFARDTSGVFAFDSIPASRGTLFWFSDSDNNNRVTFGKLVPWRSPERFFIVPDTIEAKARWEIEGLRIRACD